MYFRFNAYYAFSFRSLIFDICLRFIENEQEYTRANIRIECFLLNSSNSMARGTCVCPFKQLFLIDLYSVIVIHANKMIKRFPPYLLQTISGSRMFTHMRNIFVTN